MFHGFCENSSIFPLPALEILACVTSIPVQIKGFPLFGLQKLQKLQNTCYAVYRDIQKSTRKIPYWWRTCSFTEIRAVSLISCFMVLNFSAQVWTNQRSCTDLCRATSSVPNCYVLNLNHLQRKRKLNHAQTITILNDKKWARSYLTSGFWMTFTVTGLEDCRSLLISCTRRSLPNRKLNI